MSLLPIRTAATLFGLAISAALVTAPLRQACADPVTPDQASSLETQIRAWLVDAVGPKITLPKRPVEVTAAGDHYDLAVPFSVLLDTSGTPAAGPGSVTASLKPLDQGKWALDDVRMPSPGHFAFDMGPPGAKLPVVVETRMADQNTHILFDQNFATPSTMTSSVGRSMSTSPARSRIRRSISTAPPPTPR